MIELVFDLKRRDFTFKYMIKKTGAFLVARRKKPAEFLDTVTKVWNDAEEVLAEWNKLKTVVTTIPTKIVEPSLATKLGIGRKV